MTSGHVHQMNIVKEGPTHDNIDLKKMGLVPEAPDVLMLSRRVQMNVEKEGPTHDNIDLKKMGLVSEAPVMFK